MMWTLPQNNVVNAEPGHLADHDDIYGCLSALMSVASPGPTPSGDATGATDLAAINAAIAARNIVTLPANTSSNPYYIDGDIPVGSYQALLGCGPGPAGTYVQQVATTANGVTVINPGGASSIINPFVSGIWFNGPGSGSGSGIGGGGATQVIEGMTLSRVMFNSFGGPGVALQTIIASTLDTVEAASNGGPGIYLYGSGGNTPTSLTVRNCYSHSNSEWGYYIVDTNYSTLISCAADVNGADGQYNYEIAGGNNVTLVGCGHEQAAPTGNGSPGGYKINGGTGHSLMSCFVSSNAGVAFWVTGSAAGVTLTSCQEASADASATASFKTDSGTSSVIINPAYVTAPSYASGTAYSLIATGGTAH